MKQQRQKRPNAQTRFSWGRVVSDNGSITYRLFRRDYRNALHMSIWRFDPGTDRKAMAQQLLTMRREFLAQVDTIELHLLGLAA